MAEEVKTEIMDNGPENGNDSAQYIETIKNMRANSVPKADYEKLMEQNKQLLNALSNGETLKPTEEEPKVSINELREKVLNSEGLDNLTYIDSVLKLRNELIKQGGADADPFLPTGQNIVPEANDYECAERVATVLQHCVDYAEGDSDVFTNELQRLTIDTAPFNGKKKK